MKVKQIYKLWGQPDQQAQRISVWRHICFSVKTGGEERHKRTTIWFLNFRKCVICGIRFQNLRLTLKFGRLNLPPVCKPLNSKFIKSCRVAPGLERYSHHAVGANLCACMCENILRDERESGTWTVQRYHFSVGQGGVGVCGGGGRWSLRTILMWLVVSEELMMFLNERKNKENRLHW